MSDITLHEKLVEIQKELKAPKSEHNAFAHFDYRSAEKILEAVKPLAHKRGCSVVCTDEMIHVGDRHYVKAIAVLSDGNSVIEACASAREQEIKKGMTEDQITGSASSYARKYALSGLFAIDDTKDSDSQDNTSVSAKKSIPPFPVDDPATDKQRGLIKQLLERKNVAVDEMPAYLESEFGIIPGSTMTKQDAKNIISELMGSK